MSGKLEELEARLQALRENPDKTAETVDALNEIAEEMTLSDPRRALEVSSDTYELAKHLSYKEGAAYSLGLMGFCHYQLSDHETAVPELVEALSLAEESGYHSGKAKVLNVLGSVQLSLGNYEQAMSHLVEALRIFRSDGDAVWEARSLYMIGTVHHELGDLERSLLDYQNALALFEQAREEVDPELAKIGEARGLTGLGTVYQSLGDHEQALQYHNRALKLYQGSGNSVGEARALNDLGTIYQQLGDHERALKLHLESLEIREEVGARQAQSTSLINIGNLHIQQKDPDKALEVLHRALAIAQEVKSKPRIYQSHQALSEAYELKGDLASALDHHQAFHQLKQEVLGDETNAKIKNLQIGFEVESAHKEAEIIRVKNVELEEKNDQLEQLLKEIKEAETQLIQSEKMAALGSLVASLVHEVNSPLGGINSAADVSNRVVTNIIDVLERSESLDEIRDNGQLRRYLEVLQNSNQITATASERLTRILTSLKSFARLDEAKFQEADLHEGLESTLTLLEHDLRENIRVQKEYGELPRVRCYPGELNQVFMNLLTNAAQAIAGDGTITIQTSAENGKVRVRIADTGAGIPPAQMPTLFEPSFTKKGARVKAGMGLFTAYNILQKHKGKLEVESEVGKGTTFTLVLPTNLREPQPFFWAAG